MTAAPARRRLTEELLADVTGVNRAEVSATEPGVAAGLDAARQLIFDGHLGHCTIFCTEGQAVTAGTVIAEIVGTAQQLAGAEDVVLGPLGFAGGVARRCRNIMDRRPEGLRVVCGGWKKLPGPLKPLLRDGLAAGGVAPRLVDGDFVYVDKNVVTLSGGISEAVTAARRLAHGPVAVQVTTSEAAITAARAGASIIMVDTGRLQILRDVDKALRDNDFRGDITLAFGGGVGVEDLQEVRRSGADIVDLGRAILDAPLWDVHMVVQL